MIRFIPFAIPSGSSPAVQTQTKSATITTNGESVTVEPDSGFLLSSATVTANIPTEEKTLSVTENGNYTINPSSGKLMTKASVSVSVSSGLAPFIAEYDYQTFTPAISSGQLTDNVNFTFSQLSAVPDLILITAGHDKLDAVYDFGGGVYFNTPFGMKQPKNNFFTGYRYYGSGAAMGGWAMATASDTSGVMNASKDGFTFVQSSFGGGAIGWKAGWTYHIIAVRLKVPV